VTGDGGDKGDSRGNDGKGKCNVEKMVEATAEATGKKMAVAKATVVLTAEATTGAAMAKTVETMQRQR
jgi:hypothetical protein